MRAMCSLIPAGFQGKIYDLGSGFGTLAYFCARQFPQAQVYGFEISPIPYLLSKIIFRRKNLHFIKKNFYHEDLRQADIVLCYLFPGGMKKLEELPWKRLISNTFAFSTHSPLSTITLRDLHQSKIYLY